MKTLSTPTTQSIPVRADRAKVLMDIYHHDQQELRARGIRYMVYARYREWEMSVYRNGSPRFVILNIDTAHELYDELVTGCTGHFQSEDGKFKVFGMTIIEAVNVDRDFIEII